MLCSANELETNSHIATITTNVLKSANCVRSLKFHVMFHLQPDALEAMMQNYDSLHYNKILTSFFSSAELTY